MSSNKAEEDNQQQMTRPSICPRLIDYVCIVGLEKSDISFADASPINAIYQPKLLRRYPPEDYKVMNYLFTTFHVSVLIISLKAHKITMANIGIAILHPYRTLCCHENV